MENREQSIPEGWGWPPASEQAHYFVDRHSLCGEWMWLGDGELDEVGEWSPDDCVVCTRKIKRRLGLDVPCSTPIRVE